MITLTTEQAQQIEEAFANLDKAAFDVVTAQNQTEAGIAVRALNTALKVSHKALATIREARAQENELFGNSEQLKQDQAEQTNTQLMEGYRIGLAEMREKCAKVCMKQHYDLRTRQDFAEAIRAIKFEGDTGFRPASEMIAEQELQADPAVWKCACGANLYIDSDGAPASKAGQAELGSVCEYKEAYEIWNDKTQWVQETAQPKELGMHRADALKQRIEELSLQLAALVEPMNHGLNTNCRCCGANGSVTLMAHCKECKSDFWPPVICAITVEPVKQEPVKFCGWCRCAPCVCKLLELPTDKAVIAAGLEKNRG